MKSGYMVRIEWTGDMKMYQVYRLWDAQKVDEPYNRDVEGVFHNHDEAIKAAKELNQKEAERYWRGCQE